MPTWCSGLLNFHEAVSLPNCRVGANCDSGGAKRVGLEEGGARRERVRFEFVVVCVLVMQSPWLFQELKRRRTHSRSTCHCTAVCSNTVIICMYIPMVLH